MKIIKKTCRALVTLALCIYTFCLFNGITFFDYTATSEGGTLSVVGHDMEVITPAAASFWELYVSAERCAADILPGQLRTAVSKLAEYFERK